MNAASRVRVVVQSSALRDALGLDLPTRDEAGPEDWRLRMDDDVLALRRPDGVRLHADFVSGRARSRASEAALAAQPLAKALGIARLAARLGGSPHLVDATAGLGVDGWQAATLGARVTMLEKHPVVHALLSDGLTRACVADDERVRRVAARVTLERCDAVWRLREFSAAPERRPALVYLDPMYPSVRRRGRSRKGIEFLHELVGPPTDDGAALLDAALAAATHRVVVKRPAGAPPLAQSGGARPEPLHAPNTRWDRYSMSSG